MGTCWFTQRDPRLLDDDMKRTFDPIQMPRREQGRFLRYMMYTFAPDCELHMEDRATGSTAVWQGHLLRHSGWYRGFHRCTEYWIGIRFMDQFDFKRNGWIAILRVSSVSTLSSKQSRLTTAGVDVELEPDSDCWEEQAGEAEIPHISAMLQRMIRRKQQFVLFMSRELTSTQQPYMIVPSPQV
jgi:hypothetical protein